MRNSSPGSDPVYVPGDELTPPVDIPVIVGRGAWENPANRFEQIAYIPNIEDDAEPSRPATRLFQDSGRTIISRNQSPDVGFEASINPYRGCEHGCIYCYARPSHEFLGLSAGLDFETKLLVKKEAPVLLRRELLSPGWRPKPLALSGVTDPYQPVEKRLGLTRRCLEVLAEFMNPVSVITKNHLVTRDLDVLARLAGAQAATVFVSITTLNDDFRHKLEPRTSSPRRRLETIRVLSAAGIPTGVMVAPVIPGLTEPELPAILEAAAAAGATRAGYIVLRLPHGVADLFEGWLTRHFPNHKDKVMNRVRSLRGGNLNDPRFGTRMRGEGLFAEEIRKFFHLGCKRAGLGSHDHPRLSTANFRRPGAQLGLFDDEDTS